MNNLVFNGEGPVMKGWWSNPQTGDSFEVRDTYFENNQLVVQTTDGRMLNYDIVQNYVQVKNKPEEKPVIENKSLIEELPIEVTELLDDDSKTSLGNINSKSVLESKMNVAKIPTGFGNINLIKEDNINKMVISKALKNKLLPSLSVDIDWDDIPKDEMKLLVNILDVKNEEIINWYLDSININDLLAEAKVKMATKLNDVLNGKEESTIILERTPDSENNIAPDSENNIVKYPNYPINDPNSDLVTLKPSDIVPTGHTMEGDEFSFSEKEAELYKHNIDMTPKTEAEEVAFSKPKKRKTTKKTK